MLAYFYYQNSAKSKVADTFFICLEIFYFFYQVSINLILKKNLVRGVEMRRPLEKVILLCHLKAVLLQFNVLIRHQNEYFLSPSDLVGPVRGPANLHF